MSASSKIGAIKRKYQVKIKIAQREAAKDIAQVIVDFIKLRTQEEGQGTKGALKPLSESYIEQRKGNLAFFTTPDGRKVPYTPKKKPKLSSKTSPEKSNATATGQMIDALKGFSKGNIATVIVKDSTRRKELIGGKSGLTNDEVREFYEANGREFLKLSESEKSDLVDEATRLIKARLKDLL